MKALISMVLVCGLCFCSNISLYAQDGTAPPSRVSVKFKAKYPQQADGASWQKAGKEYTASFTEEGRLVRSRFGENGEWLGSETEVQEADWPAPIQQYMQDNHAGYRYLQGTRYDALKNSRYQIDVTSNSGNSYRLQFDGKGNFISESSLQQ